MSQEFLYNHRHQWSDASWLWSSALPPTIDAQQEQARRLMQQGQISAACALYGVQLSERLRKLAAVQSFIRFVPVNPAWTQELHHALRQLAPWHLAPGLARIQQHQEESTRKPPPPGSWERKLFWLSGQRQQMRWWLGVRFGASGAPELDLMATASNEHFPEPDWKQHP